VIKIGLDHWLIRTRYVRTYNNEVAIVSGIEIPEGAVVKTIKIDGITWRKANAIHAWFVEEVQEGNDDCKSYWVPRETVQKLLDLIVTALASRKIDDRGNITHEAETVLPTQGGFFFGSTDYDEYYWEDLESTEKELKELLNKTPEDWDFEYGSSW